MPGSFQPRQYDRIIIPAPSTGATIMPTNSTGTSPDTPDSLNDQIPTISAAVSAAGVA